MNCLEHYDTTTTRSNNNMNIIIILGFFPVGEKFWSISPLPNFKHANDVRNYNCKGFFLS